MNNSDVNNECSDLNRFGRTDLAARRGVAESLKRKKSGRPPSGPGGLRVSEYPQVMIRLPRPTKATLDALSGATGVPVWKLIDRAVSFYVRHLSADDRRLIGEIRSRRARD